MQGDCDMQKKQIVLGIFLVILSMMLAKPPYIFGNEAKSSPPSAYLAQGSLVDVRPSFPDILCDLIFMRPVAMVGLGIGLGATVLAIPFALPTGTMGQVSQTLIVGPFDYAFVRPLGDWQDD
jgi:hypothetical protein